jgi:hypothetical protein
LPPEATTQQGRPSSNKGCGASFASDTFGGDPANESQQRLKLTLSERLDNFVQVGAKVRWRALFIQYRERPFQQVYRSAELTVFPARIVCGRLGR